jgi:uncharacterized membrane protein
MSTSPEMAASLFEGPDTTEDTRVVLALEGEAHRLLTESDHPGLAALRRHREGSLGDRTADRITAFAGSWPFLWAHLVWWGPWLVLGVLYGFPERFPFGLLTMLLSLEAIALAYFIMVSQNRADAKRQVIAATDHTNLVINTELTRRVHEQTTEIASLRKDLTRILTLLDGDLPGRRRTRHDAPTTEGAF